MITILSVLQGWGRTGVIYMEYLEDQTYKCSVMLDIIITKLKCFFYTTYDSFKI